MASAKGSNTSKSSAKVPVRQYPRGFVPASPEQLLNWFPPASFIPVDKRVERCQKCGKAFKKISVEGKEFRICGCVDTLKGK